MRSILAVLLCLVCSSIALAQTEPEAVSLLGARLYAQADEKGEIPAAAAKLAADPKNMDLLIALGRAQANAWRYRDAIATYTRGIEIAPNDARNYRHRGHRYISVRDFNKARDDMQRAAELNDADFDIWYHLGLAHYLLGDFNKAEAAYRRCLAVAEKAANDDSIIAVADWLYMTLRRAGKGEDAKKVLDRITPDMKVKENKSYFDRLLFYKGLKKESELVDVEKAADLDIATVGYGLGNWHLYNGNLAKAVEYFRRIVSGKYWPAFGFIAAEAELAKMR
ncbi:MAG: tetratricopeptide repeat protein [Acidobacteria bacterium]|nr:tetratricopeptide repeat protein [Acidobacteriota bacterium]MCW5971570.1 tetratricopeptide repeat protein [Blastocatellales bacterium]